MTITKFCIRRPVTTAMFFTALMVLGVFSVLKMPMDLFPQITFPSINIFTSYSGAGPEEVERLITIPIERSVATVNRVKSITSTSEEGSSRVRVNFSWGISLEEATNDIRANLDRVKRNLPEDAGTPVIFKFDSSAMPVLTIGISGTDEETLRRIAEDDLSYQLQRVEGVAGVDVRGGKNKEIRILLRQDRLEALRITSEQVTNALRNENAMLPAGYLEIGSGDFLLRTKGEFQDLAEIENVIVANREGIPVFLKDLARVEAGTELTRSKVRIDGNPGVVISVQKQSDANTVAVADRVYQVLDQLKEQFPEINLRVINDNSTFIRNAVKSVSDAAIIGAFLAALVLLLFLHNLRATAIVSIVMPISILATLILAYFNKMTLNTVSLGGLALGVGMLVDNSVVVLDNIFRHYQKGGVDLQTAALDGTSEMGPALSASTMTTICVFFPLIYITGRSGLIFKELSYMVIFSLICSLAVAVTLIPTLCAKFLKVRDLEEKENGNIRGVLIQKQHQLEKSYQAALEWCLGHKTTTLSVCALVFGLTILLYPLIGTELIQNSDEGVISVNIQLPTGTRLDDTDRHSLKVEENIRKILPELANMEAWVGGRDVNESRLTLRLKNKGERRRTTQEIVNQLQGALQIPGARVRVWAQSNMRMLYGGSQEQVAIDIRGYDQNMARQAAVLIQDKLSRIPGINNVTISREEARPELTIRINRQRAADYGLTASQIASAIQSNMEGKVATIFRKDGQETNVRVVLEETSRTSLQDLKRILVTGSNNRVVSLASIINVVQDSSPVTIERKDQERNITVSAGITGRDLASVIRDIRKSMAEIKLPQGLTPIISGDYEEQQQSFQEMLLALTLALLLVYMVMASQFESFLDPLLIMFSVPFALGGVILILLLTDTNFNTQVYIGLIMLGGIVVNNAIVLVSYYRILLKQGLSLSEAVIHGSRSRLRPILMTTVTTILGLIPLAAGIGEGSETQSPLARTVIGGLSFSAVLTLFLIPVVFVAIEKRRLGFKQKQNKRKSMALTGLVIMGLIFGMVNPAMAADPPKLTVKEAVKRALEKTEDGKIIRLRRELAQSVYREKQGNKRLNMAAKVESSNDGTGQSTAASLTAEQSLPLSNLAGIASLSDRIADANLKITDHSMDYQEQQFIYLIADTFQKEWLAGRDLQLAEDNFERSVRFHEEVQTRSKLGLTSLSDEIGAEAQVAAARTNLNRARQLYRLAQNRFRQFLEMDGPYELVENPITALPDIPLTEYLQLAGTNRSDLKAARETVAQYESLVKLARLAKQLGITLEWNLERDNWQAGLALTNQNREGTTEEWRLSGAAGMYYQDPSSSASATGSGNGTITFGLKWTLLDGGVRKERIKQAEYQLALAREELKKLEKNVGYEVEDAYYNYLYQRDKLQSCELQYRYNQIYLDAAQAKLRLGLVPVKEVLDAQVLMHQSAAELEKVKSDLYLAGIYLKKAVGNLTLESVN